MSTDKSTFAGVRTAAMIQLGVSLGLVVAVTSLAGLAPTRIGPLGAMAIAALCGLASLIALVPFRFVRHPDHAFAAAVGSMLARTALSGAALAALVAGLGWPQKETALFFLLCYLVLLCSEAWATVGTLRRSDIAMTHRSERVA